MYYVDASGMLALCAVMCVIVIQHACTSIAIARPCMTDMAYACRIAILLACSIAVAHERMQRTTIEDMFPL